jgi:hypothetical protein
MANHAPDIISTYEVLFAVRTGITILMPRVAALDGGIEQPASFRISPDNPRDLVIESGGRTAVLKSLQKDYLDEAIERGFIMFYETKDDEVVRCTPCSFAKKS